MYAVNLENETMHAAPSYRSVLAKGEIDDAPCTRSDLLAGISIAAVEIVVAGKAVDGADADQPFPQEATSVLIAEPNRSDGGICDCTSVGRGRNTISVNQTRRSC